MDMRWKWDGNGIDMGWLWNDSSVIIHPDPAVD